MNSIDRFYSKELVQFYRISERDQSLFKQIGFKNIQYSSSCMQFKIFI